MSARWVTLAASAGSVEGAAANQASRISSSAASEVRRRERASTLASFHRRAPSAVWASPHSAARTPGTLLAAIETPVPVQQQTTPRSARPPATASPTARPTSGQGSSSATTTTSWPRSARPPLSAAVSAEDSSVPKATRTAGAYAARMERTVAGGDGRRTVVIVPHTHWDREWYAPFQTFRLRLVELLDQLLDLLEADPGYAHFMLD